MRFLAIVSVFFAVTHVAFAALELPADISTEQHLATGYAKLHAHLSVEKPEATLPPTQTPPRVVRESVTYLDSHTSFHTGEGNHHLYQAEPTPQGPLVKHAVVTAHGVVLMEHLYGPVTPRGRDVKVTHVHTKDASGREVATAAGHVTFFLPRPTSRR
ncbi:hypothetical protein K439DRAFT_676242 [Ramaria rubella]|nr:hypothetical protein K439DRAFT_676242 [Ramaria rubella]